MRADAKRKRELIIDAATRQFRTVPDARITLEGIAQEAGVGIATLYRHFPTKHDLRLACALNLFDTLAGTLNEALETFEDDPEAHWEALIWRLVDYGIGMLVATLADQGRVEIDPELMDKRGQFFADVEVLMDKAASHGLVDPDISALELASELIVVTRPQSEVVNELFPDVSRRLVQHLLLAWRRSER
ncbi:TetR/AcrR family transcriptional regulator [Corynebacterium liangguodongii]|uniref:TetR/AcrR family transcriptional regulator n=1 Tax=Corynebacterium liangguodongii TaxID=2079535 RepID=A0A2S0WBF7_9CORY|nr:TetR/AcrR family transcriptional regulator [Corynebacterium liangguodongii]AWB83097.1 TetR/AcrR family transcriptional regulator [Corynebacterium liangguodongii]PWB99302.1 TetR/AcrR family transcriptional regulator [Corynebacterium liangguodongii]